MSFIFPPTLECILGLSFMCACVYMLYFYASSLGQRFLWVIQRHHKLPTLYFLAPLVLILV